MSKDILRQLNCDEEVSSYILDINKRRGSWRCPFQGHDWINATLRWDRAIDDRSHWSVHIQEPDNGASMRFCRRCKVIDCVHLFEDETLRLDETTYSYSEYLVGTCKRCHKRILRSGWTVCTPTQRAIELVHEVAREAGTNMERVGSGFHCDLPVSISKIIDASGEEVAREELKRVFAGGNCELHMMR